MLRTYDALTHASHRHHEKSTITADAVRRGSHTAKFLAHIMSHRRWLHLGETNIFKVLADSQRREILTMLKDGRMNAGEIAEKLNVTPAALSYHLKLLKGADLITEYKEKNFIYYEINTSVFEELILWINQFGGTK